MSGTNAAEREIRAVIEAEGPIGLDRYMALALGHPLYGYYATRDPFGQAGDFTTAPEISQMFGELLGLWAASVWVEMGRPDPVRLVELGPGRGTLMADALRATRRIPGFHAAIRVHLVETSATLRTRQQATLAGAAVPVCWHASLAEVPAGPLLLLANEFLDALPIRHFVRAPDGWRERLVGIGPDGRLVFGLAGAGHAAWPGLPGDIVEIGEAAAAVAGEIGARLARDGGAALVIDYGHVRSSPGETLQAVRRHGFADPLDHPGEADLTAHVDFAAVGRAASRSGARLHGPVPQAAFLEAIGIGERAAALMRGADPDRAAGIAAARDRLLDRTPTGMGALFKVLGLAGASLTQLPGLAAAEPLATAALRDPKRELAAC